MIIAGLAGGMGNQMFQYAAGRRLAHGLGAELKLDVSWFEHQELRRYSLGGLNIRERFANANEVDQVRDGRWGVWRRLKAGWAGAVLGPSHTHYREKKKFVFDPEMLGLTGNVFLEGSWQNPAYFEEIEDVIRREFTVETPLGRQNSRLSDQIRSCESVSVHVRRGDYATNPHTNRVHGTCEPDYYERAVSRLAPRLNDPRFFVFSDDPDWARSNLSLPDPVAFVEGNDDQNAHEDLRLMSLCRHHVIANSTLSWWSAWLASAPDKLVVAPKCWIRSRQYDAEGIIPQPWIRL